MNDIRTRVLVSPDHGISGTAPPQVPPGEHAATISVPATAVGRETTEPFDMNDLPGHDLGPWPLGLSLRREDLYDDAGR